MYPKWKYRIDKGEFRATLVGTEKAEQELGAAWVEDPKSLGVPVVPCGGPPDASGRVAFGPVPLVAGVTAAKIGG